MKLIEIVQELGCKVICGDNQLNMELEMAFASDLMSDVLTLRPTNILLITGLANLQSIRTAEMAGFNAILFVRNKKVTPDMVEVALENDMVILECSYSMFKACGILFRQGLLPVY